MKTKSHSSKVMLIFKYVRKIIRRNYNKLKIRKHLLFVQDALAFIVNMKIFLSIFNAYNVELPFVANVF
jgi:hypothetical protein